MKLYLLGPMRGRSDFNMDEFDNAAEKLRRHHFVYNPHDVDRDAGYRWRGVKGTNEDLDAVGFDLPSTMRKHLAWITAHADGVVCLPGWMDSDGSRREVLVAKTIGLPIFAYRDGEIVKIDVETRAEVFMYGWVPRENAA